MSTVQGTFEDRDVEARFAPDGFTRVGPGYYRRKSPAEKATDDAIAALKAEAADGTVTEPIEAPNPLDDIASLLRRLTYGEMMDLAAAVWAVKSEGDVTAESLPGILHRWSTAQK